MTLDIFIPFDNLRRVNIIVGPNGSGKTRALSDIAKAVGVGANKTDYGDPWAEATVARFGSQGRDVTDGWLQVADVVARIAAARQTKILLIDGFETHLSPSWMRDLWCIVEEQSVEFGIQVFVTTHSLEVIDIALGIVPTANLALFRLHKGGVRRVDGGFLEILRFDCGMEVR